MLGRKSQTQQALKCNKDNQLVLEPLGSFTDVVNYLHAFHWLHFLMRAHLCKDAHLHALTPAHTSTTQAYMPKHLSSIPVIN